MRVERVSYIGCDEVEIRKPIPTKEERKRFAAMHLCPFTMEVSKDVEWCHIDGDEFIHIVHYDGTDQLVCVSGCTFKEMTKKVLEHI